MNLDTKALIGFFKEIEASRDRQKAETEFQRDVFKRAKEKHFDAKAMRIVLQRRAMETSKRDEQDYNVDCYERALEGKKAAIEALEQGATIREAAEAGGISTGSAAALAKGVQESSFVNTVEQGDRQSPLRDGEASADITTASALPSPPSAGVHTQFYGGAPVATSTVGPAVTTIPTVLEIDLYDPEGDGIAIPSFLRRTA
jgi:uncharacterized protein (UPF0335 family)